MVFDAVRFAEVGVDAVELFDGQPQLAVAVVERITRLAELVTGTIDPDEAIASIRQEMEAAGLDQVREEAQRQLDAYLETRQ